MGIRSDVNPAGRNTFSEDVLKIEKCGPSEDYLTIIDVPGIFRNITEGVTSNTDRELVKNMVKRYIKDSRTIILAVLPSNVDVATQEILTFAEEADPAGDRTLGILTKADLLKEQSAKSAVISLVGGQRKSLKLGYHVVTNRGGDDHGEEDDAATALREREAMFLEHPWHNLPDERVGVSALRERLEDLLGEITDGAFPKLRTETRQRLEDAEKKLKDLGAPRQTEREQQQYLVGIASNFQNFVRAALAADYSAHPAFDKNEMRLITAVVNATEQFNTDFNKSARTYLFESEEGHDEEDDNCENNDDGIDDGEGNDGESEDDKGHDDSDCSDQEENSDEEVDALDIPDSKAFPDLEGIIVTNWDVEAPHKGIMKWLMNTYKGSRGLDLGSLGNGILPNIFREQSVKWEGIAKKYLSKIILLVHRFIILALDAVCKDAQVLQDVFSALAGDLYAQYESSINHAIFLVNVERVLKPYTLNHYFNHNQQRSHGARIQETLRPQARHEYANTATIPESELVVDFGRVASAVTDKSNTAHATETMHDVLEAYYKVAYKRFVDNLFTQAVNYKLLSGPESPLRLFSEQWVLALSEEKLLAVAGESRRTTQRRERLKKEIQDLELAMKILR